jgi:hypothetical protein
MFQKTSTRRTFSCTSLVALVALGAPAATACGKPAASPVSAAGPALPGVTAMVFNFRAQTSSQASDATERATGQAKDALVAAGIRLGESGAEGSLSLEYALEEESGPLGGFVQVQGSKKSYKITATLTAFNAAATSLDRFQTTFSSSDDANANMQDLVQKLARSSRVAKAGEAVKAAGAAKATANEGEAYLAAEPKVCASAIKLNACDLLEKYLVAHPSGAHAAEAKSTVEASKPKLANLQKDEDLWQAKSGFASCRDQHNTEACTGVELYLVKFPAGLHADEARGLLKPAPVEAPDVAYIMTEPGACYGFRGRDLSEIADLERRYKTKMLKACPPKNVGSCYIDSTLTIQFSAPNWTTGSAAKTCLSIGGKLQ